MTAMPLDVQDFNWSPDARQLVICADVDPDQPPEKEKTGDAPRVRVVSRIRFRYDTLGWRGDAQFHLFVVSVDGGSPRQLTEGDWSDLG